RERFLEERDVRDEWWGDADDGRVEASADATGRIDPGRRAPVDGADELAPGLDRADDREPEVELALGAPGEPRIVREVDEQVRAHAHGLTTRDGQRVLVAVEDGEPNRSGHEGDRSRSGLDARPAREDATQHGEDVRERDGLAEPEEVPLVVRG